MFKEIKKCRICGNKELIEILNLGSQYLTGIFPNKKSSKLEKYPLILVKCHGDKNVCHLVQLKHNQDYKKMFGPNYGYQSSLNKSMVNHLESKVIKILSKLQLNDEDIIVDIGSNDGTTLSFFPKSMKRVGFDPIGKKFKNNYTDKILIENFFNSKDFLRIFNKKASIIFSISMFYDVEDPILFCKEIEQIIDQKNGVWILEQSYLPEMIKKNSYDTICHEHLTYYSLSQINWITERTNLKIVDFEVNQINGGSCSITVVHKNNSKFKVNSKIQEIMKNEKKYKEIKIYEDFKIEVEKTKKELVKELIKLKKMGESVSGIGASTKGNVILQYCELDDMLLSEIGEVNKEKFGHKTPGSWIPIISEQEVLNKKNKYLLILPWHFKDFFLQNKRFKNKNLIFPLPRLEIIKN